MTIKSTKFFILCINLILTYALVMLPSVSYARKVIKTNLVSVIDRSSIIISGKCLSYQCISDKELLSVPFEKCQKDNAGVARLYSVKIDKIIIDRNNFLKHNMISSYLDVQSNRSDTNSICSESTKEQKNNLLFLSYNLKPQPKVRAVFGNLLHQDLSNIKQVKMHLSESLN